MVFDMDSSGNVLAGGTSSSSSIVSSTAPPNAFLVYFDSTGTVKWGVAFDDAYNEVRAIAFSTDGTKAAIMSDV